MAKSIINNQKYSLYFLVLILFSSGCIFSTSDSGEKDKNIPHITSVSISDGQTFSTRDITVFWEGDEFADLYQYSLDGIQSDWIDTTAVDLTDLDETEHIFTIQAQKDSVFSSVTTIHFDVDAIQGPGIIFSPRKISESSDVSLIFEDMENLMTAHIEILCEDECAWIKNFSLNELTEEYDRIITFTDEQDYHRLIIDIGFAGATQGITGSINIGSFELLPLGNTGTITIDSSKTVFRDTSNNPIVMNEFDTVRIKN